LLAHLHFFNAKAKAKNAKEPAISPCDHNQRTLQNISMKDLPAPNSTYPKGGVSCFADTFVVAESAVLRMKFSGKNPALRVAAKRYAAF
jgi:hypothetical protein